MKRSLHFNRMHRSHSITHPTHEVPHLHGVVKRVNPPVQGEGFDLVLPDLAALGLDARSDVRLQNPVLTLNRSHLEQQWEVPNTVISLNIPPPPLHTHTHILHTGRYREHETSSTMLQQEDNDQHAPIVTVQFNDTELTGIPGIKCPCYYHCASQL